MGNHCVQVFAPNGKIKVLGSGTNRKLGAPFGIAIDFHGRVYVSEFANHCISVFSPEGDFVTSFGAQGNGPGELQKPAGLSFDSDGVLYVCDRGNNRIQLF